MNSYSSQNETYQLPFPMVRALREESLEHDFSAVLCVEVYKGNDIRDGMI